LYCSDKWVYHRSNISVNNNQKCTNIENELLVERLLYSSELNGHLVSVIAVIMGRSRDFVLANLQNIIMGQKLITAEKISNEKVKNRVGAVRGKKSKSKNCSHLRYLMEVWQINNN